MKVSVIVPVYNTSKYLSKCLDSLVNQTLEDIEIIVINDNSPDDSKEIINEYKNKYKNKIVVITNSKNMGIGYNRNLGIKKAKGKYVAFVDSDDWVELSMYEKMCNMAETQTLDMVVCDQYDYHEKNNKIIPELIPSFNASTIRQLPNLLLDINYGPCNKLYLRKKIIENKIEFSEKLKYEDMKFVVPMIAISKIGKVNEPLYYYRIRGKSETTSMDERVFDILKIIDDVNAYLSTLNFYDDIKEYTEYLNIRTIFRYTLQQKYQNDKGVRVAFINEAFSFLDSKFPNWKNNTLFKKRNIVKRTIEKSKILTNIYCSMFYKLNKNIDN